jgi:hypothetical protein
MLEAQYEAGEIWVGKHADVGAHLAVKSVRGDKVLWVDSFGLHDGPFASLRELVRTQGRCLRQGAVGCWIVCDPSFSYRNAIYHQVRTIDKLVVRELSALVPRLRHVVERSDPMLAIYPGCAYPRTQVPGVADTHAPLGTGVSSYRLASHHPHALERTQRARLAGGR